jgi:hypothetical protein
MMLRRPPVLDRQFIWLAGALAMLGAALCIVGWYRWLN